MNCQRLAALVQQLEPEATTEEVARLCLLLATANDDLTQFEDPARLKAAWQEMELRLNLASDQHAAVTEELATLAASDPRRLDRDQVWILLRAIKVQSQALEMYLGGVSIDV